METKNWPDYYKHLNQMLREVRNGVPKVMEGFAKIHEGAFEDAALSKKHKELIALGIGIAVRCDGCLSAHVRASLAAGATEEEIIETIGVAILMGGGPSVMYAGEAVEALKQWKEKMDQEKGS